MLRGERFAVLIDIVYGQRMLVASIVNPYRHALLGDLLLLNRPRGKPGIVLCSSCGLFADLAGNRLCFIGSIGVGTVEFLFVVLDRIIRVILLDQVPNRIEDGVALDLERIASFVNHRRGRRRAPAREPAAFYLQRAVPDANFGTGNILLLIAVLRRSVHVLQRMGVGVLLIGDGLLHVPVRHLVADLLLVGRISRDDGRGHVIRFLKFERYGMLRGDRFAVLIDIVYGQRI